ncbi:hypothetical protein [Kangiella sp.]|uniref:hypothetical protein n=1 Tax=Kangiella sp. TaxID=1920245 RepID=UPI00199BC8EA|nr:hypothetical protein [Kangiella sp.]MBD3654781.1 hypothetical protein [Kangiella sp.]
MNKMITTALIMTLGLGLSQVGFAKEHKGPQSNNARNHASVEKRHDANRVEQRHNRDNRFEHRRDDRRDDRWRDHRRDDRRDNHRHSDSRGHDRHYGSHDRYRDNYHPRPKHPNYRVYHDRYYPRYRSYPTTVYYLGQDWYYYGGYYHPYPRGHIHTHYCSHRYWEPLAVGIILGSVLGW